MARQPPPAADGGRELRFGIRLHVISRDTSAAAWAQAQRLLAGIAGSDIRAVQAGLGRSESEGQRRMLALHGGSRDGLEVSPNLWAGGGLVRGGAGAGTALVGSHTEVADRIAEYHDLGVTEFVLSGHPHVEEAYRFGEGVLPILRRRGLWRHRTAIRPHRSATCRSRRRTGGPVLRPAVLDPPGRRETVDRSEGAEPADRWCSWSRRPRRPTLSVRLPDLAPYRTIGTAGIDQFSVDATTRTLRPPAL